MNVSEEDEFGRCSFDNAILLDKDATDYFRGIVKSGEISPRVLELTEYIIRLNPAHYSAWSALSLCICIA
jgi:hypothetical protein